MKVRSIGWLGVRTKNAAALADFYRDVLGLEALPDPPSGARFRLPDGAEVHVYDYEDEDHAFFSEAPVVGFFVDSFAETRNVMLAAGVDFLYPEPQRDGRRAWQHFRAPDGNVYEIIGPDDLDILDS